MAGKQLLFYYNPEHKGSNKGVNFSSEYRFYVDYEKRDGIDTYTLRRDVNWEAEDHPDIFASNPDLSAPNITGVTAIVGENGTGKTTLMTNILNTLINYRENPELLSRDKPFILVVKNKDGKGGTNHLWTAYAYDNHEIYEYTFMRDSSTIPQECFCWITDIPISLADILPDISLIYLTNSFYESRRLPDNESHIFTALTPVKIARIANTFYDARLHYPHPEGYPDKLNCKMLVTRYSEELRRHFADDGYYQSIWDAQYYFNKYKRSQKSEEECVHGLVNLRKDRIVMWVGFYNAYDAGYSCAKAILREAEGSLNTQTADSSEIQERHFDINDINQRKWQNEGKPEDALYAAVFRHLSYQIRGCLSDNTRLNRSETSGIDFIKSQLYASLLFEWCITYGRDIPENCNDIKSFLQSEFEYVENHRRKKIKSKFSEWPYNDYRFTNANYFLNAIEGIEKLSAFSNTVTTRVANPSNFYDYQFCFDNSNKMSFDMTIRFFEYIEWCWHYCPFILKYISIMQPGISSGERALQNFLSWLNLLTDYSDLLGDRSIRLGKNLILLIDEMDLYLHPEWQRRFLNELITELKTHLPPTLPCACRTFRRRIRSISAAGKPVRATGILPQTDHRPILWTNRMAMPKLLAHRSLPCWMTLFSSVARGLWECSRRNTSTGFYRIYRYCGRSASRTEPCCPRRIFRKK